MIANLKGMYNVLDFRLSHKLLLIRKSDIVKGKAINNDILFQTVFYIEMPTRFEDMTLILGTSEDEKYLKDKLGSALSLNFQKVYVIQNDVTKYYVVASDVQLTENELPPLESGL